MAKSIKADLCMRGGELWLDAVYKGGNIELKTFVTMLSDT